MNNNNTQPRQRYPGLYVGNLTWWTTDRDVIDAINSIGISDVQEVKFYENRNNGQSKGFCLVTFASDASLPIVIEKLPHKELHGHNPVVTPYNRQNLSLFESQTKPRPQINQSNGPSPHAAGIMGINSITGVHAAANAQASGLAVGGMAYPGMNAGGATLGGYNQPAGGMNPVGGPRPGFQSNFRMGMRGPRPMMPRPMQGSMNNGPMMQGAHQMNRMRFMQQQNWNNSQGGPGGGGGVGGYNPAASRIGPQVNMDISNRLGGVGPKQVDDLGQEMLSSSSAQNYYPSHHQNSQSDHYRVDDRLRDHRDLRDDRESRRLDERSSRLDERSLRHDERAPRDDRLHKSDDRISKSLRDDRLSRRDDDRSSRRSGDGRDDIRRDDIRRDDIRRDDVRRDDVRRDDIRREDLRRERDDRSSRREEKSLSSRHKDSGGRGHRSDERIRSRSRSKDRSRDGRERRGGGGGSERDRDRDRDREREREKERERDRERERPDRRERY